MAKTDDSAFVTPMDISDTPLLETNLSPRERFKVGNLIGKGAYGRVVQGFDTQTANNVAMKAIDTTTCGTHEVRQIVRELRSLRLCKLSHILHLICAFYDEADKNVYIVTPLYHFTLHQIIQSDKSQLTPRHRMHIMGVVVDALAYLHKMRIVHRDVKPDNIFMNKECDVVLGDFGMSRDLLSSGESEGEHARLSNYVVTRWYRAPEVLCTLAYDGGVDIWAAGCVWAEMLLGYALFPGTTEHDQMRRLLLFYNAKCALHATRAEVYAKLRATADLDVVTTQLKDRIRMIPPDELELLASMLLCDNKFRSPAAQLLSHPFFADHVKQVASASTTDISSIMRDFSGSTLPEVWRDMETELALCNAFVL